MPSLPNAKHERFCQELAKGKSAEAAYAEAGYKPDRKNASKLRQRPDILPRVAEILEGYEKMNARATEKAMEALAIDKQWVMARLVQNAEIALGNVLVKGPVLTKDGGTTTVREIEYMDRDPAAANQALNLLGKEFGMFIERTEIGGPGDFGRMADDELERFISERARVLGLGSSGEGAAGDTAESPGARRLN